MACTGLGSAASCKGLFARLGVLSVQVRDRIEKENVSGQPKGDLPPLPPPGHKIDIKVNITPLLQHQHIRLYFIFRINSTVVPCTHCSLVAVYAVAYLVKLWQSEGLLCSCGSSAAAVAVTVKAAMVQVMCNFHQQ